MSDLAIRWNAAYWLNLPISLKVACLFCLLGLTVTATILPLIPSAELNWVLAHIE